MTDPPAPAGDVFTIGHSTQPIDAFVSLLQRHRIAQVVDVRTLPRSRRNPQFHGPALEASLHEAGIAYAHVPAVGGLRTPLPGSANDGWEEDAFRGYADHMGSPAFAEGLRRLMALASAAPTSNRSASGSPLASSTWIGLTSSRSASGSALASPTGLGLTALMCAEADWRRCHRRLLADALTVVGWRVRHIVPGLPQPEPHVLTRFLVVENGRIGYPAAQLRLG